MVAQMALSLDIATTAPVAQTRSTPMSIRIISPAHDARRGPNRAHSAWRHRAAKNDLIAQGALGGHDTVRCLDGIHLLMRLVIPADENELIIREPKT
jgi:hypothetical protein